MIHVHELKHLKMYNSNNKLIIPTTSEDKNKGSVVTLLTPNIESSINMINSTSVINRHWFKSYYIEKSINTIITTENNVVGVEYDYDPIVDSINMCLTEGKLSANKRKGIPDKNFGVPSKRKFPLNDEEHVRAAIRMFNHVDPEDEETLAKNIIKKLDDFEITDLEVGEKNRFSKYYKAIKEYTTYRDVEVVAFNNKNDINEKMKRCSEFYYAEENDYFYPSLSNIKYMNMAYVDKELSGFSYCEKNLRDKNLQCYVYCKSMGDLQNEDDVITAMILNTRRYLLYNNKVKFLDVKCIGTNEVIMSKVAVKLEIILKQQLKKLSFSGLVSKNKDTLTIPIEDVDIVSAPMNEYCMMDEIMLCNSYLRTATNAIVFDDIFEEDAKHDAILKKMLFPERLKNQKDVLDIYQIIKESCPVIKNTKLNISQYKGMNLFFDTSYYNKAFFNNNAYTRDRGIDLYLDFLNRVTNQDRFKKAGYRSNTIFVPVMDWYKENRDIFDYTKSVNPISVLVRKLRKDNLASIGAIKQFTFIFFGTNGYFKLELDKFEKKFLSRFMENINRIINNSPIESDDLIKDTPDAIVTDIIDRIETTQKVQLYNLTGKSRNELSKDMAPVKGDNSKSENKQDIDAKKAEVVAAIKDVADSSDSVESAIDSLDQKEYIANIIQDISDEENSEIKASATRTSRINQLNDRFREKTVKGKTVKELISNSESIGDKDPLPTTKININSINADQWDNLQYINFNKSYNVDEDIMAILAFFGTRTIPVSVRDVKVEDTSTSEDLIETWTVQMEDIKGTRFTLKFDIPKFKNNRFMRLRGNDKTINGQLMNLPIIKTEKDVCQITTNYNKIFFRIFGTTFGKSNIVSDLLSKALGKYTGNKIKIKIGSNAFGALKYDLPLDYIDFGSQYSTISYGDTTFYFDQDEIRSKYEKEINYSKGIPVGYNSSEKYVIYMDKNDRFFSDKLRGVLIKDPEFEAIYNEVKPSSRCSYSKASIMNTTIPVIVVAAYCEGLTKSLNKAGIKYEIRDKRENRPRESYDCIKFKDAFLYYEIDYSSSLLMNGLKECNTEDYSIKDIDTKSMWTEMLDIFGGRIKADGLDNFYNLMFDPITIRTCEAYNLPSDFCSALFYASNLLTDSKFNKHVDITGNRFRTNELIAGYTYKALSESYADYHTKMKKTGKAVMTIKQSAIVDKVLTDNTTSDASTINDLCYAEAANTVSFKGLSGMNSERSYSLDKRTYDKSMNGILAMSTGFASTVGETRQTTVNMNISGKRGYIKDTADNKDIMNDVNTTCIAEALTPLSTTHDDPFREAMSFTQRTKHDMRVAGGDPLLITNGMDDALSNFTPDYFSINAKMDGKVVEKTSDHIVVKYKDGSIEYVDLNNKVYKNSDGGFYTSIKLKPADKLGSTVKTGDLIAYDPMSYTTGIGYDDNATYNQGTIAKIAILTTDEGFEDSCAVSRYMSNALSSNVVTKVDVNLSKNTNVYNLVKVGQKIEEGEPLMVMQNAFEDDDVNVLLKNLVDDEETVTSLGRIPIKSHNTGVIEDIKIYRTVEIDELSPSLQKIVKDYENSQNRIRKTIEKYDPEKAKEYVSDYRLDSTGKLKNVDEGVLIEIYVSYKDDFSIGDKLIILGAQKGVAKEVFDPGNEPRSSYRDNEVIDCLVSMVSFDKRMITAPLQYTLAYKFLVELDRQVKDIMGIKQDYNIHHPDLEVEE